MVLKKKEASAIQKNFRNSFLKQLFSDFQQMRFLLNSAKKAKSDSIRFTMLNSLYEKYINTCFKWNFYTSDSFIDESFASEVKKYIEDESALLSEVFAFLQSNNLTPTRKGGTHEWEK